MHVRDVSVTIKQKKCEGGQLYESSQLAAIIKRLNAMVESSDNEVQVRRFEREGQERCIVTFDGSNEMFELTETGSQEVYQFDDIDLVTLEIFELLQD